MIRLLLRTRFQSFMYSMLRGSKKQGVGTKVLYGLLFLYVAVVFVFMFGMTFSQLVVLRDAGLGWLYFSLAGILAFALGFIGSVFTAQAQLYNAQDNELLLSMPVPPYAILMSRMLMLLLMNYAYELLVLLPAGVVYCMNAAPTAASVLCFAVVALLLPLLTLAVTCAVAWVIALVSAHMRRKNLVTLLFSVGFILVYLWVYSHIGEIITGLIANGAQIGEAIRRTVFPAYHLGVAVEAGSFVSALLFALCCVLPFALVYALLSRSFVRVATTKKTAAKKQYRRRQLRVSTAPRALLTHELRRFFASSAYMLNAGMGVIFMLIAAVYIVIKKDTVLGFAAMLPGLETALPAVLAGAMCFINSFNIVSAPSVSLEGRNLWVLRSMPVRAGELLVAKARLHIVVTLPPALVLAVAACLALGLGAGEMALVLAAAVVSCLFQAYIGVAVNLKFPRFDWINETAAVKQGVSVVIVMFGTMAFYGGLLVLYLTLVSDFLPAEGFVLAVVALLAVLSLLLRIYLTGAGARRFESFEV